MDKTNKSKEYMDYFNSLPIYVQECIAQCGVDIQSVEQLKDIASGFDSAYQNNRIL